MEECPTDILFYNGVIMPDVLKEPMRGAGGYLAVSGDKVVACGNASAGELDILKKEAAQTVDLKGNLLMPGFVNGHTHAAMSILRGYADDLPLKVWLEDHIWPAEAKLTERDMALGVELSCLEMIMSGTTCFADMYFYARSTAEVSQKAGLRLIAGQGVVDFPSQCYSTPDECLGMVRDFAAEYRDSSLVFPAVMAHTAYTCCRNTLEKCSALAEELSLPLHIHLSETEEENAVIREKYGKTPTAHIKDCGMLSQKLVAAHCVHLAEEDRQMFAEVGASIIHCPESNMKLGSGCASVDEYISSGISVGLGTDGCSSNNNLDMLEEARTAALLAKVGGEPESISAQQALYMATSGSAQAWGVGGLSGRLEKGCYADLIIVNMDQPHLQPVYDYASQMVYCANGRDVLSTMVAGKWLMRERNVLTLDAEKVFAVLQKFVKSGIV